MTHQEILQLLYEETLVGNAPAVKGDVHDIGKNLCNIMLEAAGFHVIDLGVNLAVKQGHADPLGKDGYSADASAALKKAKELSELRREKVPA